MAQIVTITNPLTGQPAQVDQLEHTAQQIDDGVGFESTDYPGCYYRTVDGVTEWVNPPMILGNEYRTTERWNGKPVYVMALDFGPLPNNTITSANIPGWVSTNRAFSINIVAHGSTETVPVPVGLSGDYSSSYWYINNPNGKLYIRSRVDLSGYTSCYVYIKYTKE